MERGNCGPVYSRDTQEIALSWLSLAFSSFRVFQPGLKIRSQGKAKERAERRYKKLIIAVDFDGILCENKFPDIGDPNYKIISIIRQLMDQGHEVILWTTRNGEELTAAVDWCGNRGLHFCNVNGPAPSNEAEYKDKYPTQSRKVYADVYIDDHNIEFLSISPRVGTGIERVTSYLKEGVQKWQTKEN